MPDLYFEIGLLLESLAKNYGTPHANYYFRIHKIKPDIEDYRKKVVEYMMMYQKYVYDSFKDTPNYDKLEAYVRENLSKEVERVLDGKNKDVEKRYSYYIMNEYF